MEPSAVCAPRQMDASRVVCIAARGATDGEKLTHVWCAWRACSPRKVHHGTVESGELSTGDTLAGRAKSTIGSAARRPFSMK